MFNKIFRNMLFPAMEFYSGTKIQNHLALLNKTQWWSKEDLKELQNKKLKALIRHAYENIPYYHKVFREQNIYPDDIKRKEDLKKLPLLTKGIIRQNYSDMIARNIAKSSMEVHSSGSTGEPLKYYIDKGAYSFDWAQTFRCWSWAGYCLGDPYVKMSMNPRNTFNKKVQDILFNTKYLHISGITENNLSIEIDKIRNFNPKIIRGYASYMYGLAKLMQKLNLEYTASAIATTGDMLYPHYREAIEKQFNCKVFDCYGGESTSISFECEEHKGYHISEEDVIVEFIKDGNMVAPDETGRIVFTNLNNYVMPFIRYDISDLGKYSEEQCSCGRGLSLMKSIEGRDSDIIITPKGDFIVVHFFTFLFEYIEGVNQFQVIQEKLDKITIKIDKNEKFKANDLNYIKDETQKKVGIDVDINIEFVDEIPLSGRSGKRRLIISKVPKNI